MFANSLTLTIHMMYVYGSGRPKEILKSIENIWTNMTISIAMKPKKNDIKIRNIRERILFAK